MNLAITMLEWVIWGGTTLLAVLYLLNNNRDGGVRFMMKTQGIVLAVGSVLTFSVFSKFHLLWLIILSFFIPLITMQSRMAGAQKRVKRKVEEITKQSSNS